MQGREKWRQRCYRRITVKICLKTLLYPTRLSLASPPAAHVYMSNVSTLVFPNLSIFSSQIISSMQEWICVRLYFRTTHVAAEKDGTVLRTAVRALVNMHAAMSKKVSSCHSAFIFFFNTWNCLSVKWTYRYVLPLTLQRPILHGANHSTDSGPLKAAKQPTAVYANWAINLFIHTRTSISEIGIQCNAAAARLTRAAVNMAQKQIESATG